MNLLAPLIAVTTLSSPSSKIDLNMVALTPKEVETKLDSIILFTPTDKEGIPMSFEFDVDGNKKKIYFAAFSPSAINFLNDRVIPQSKDKELKYTYSPKSLTKFSSLIEIEKNKSKKDVLDVVYIPDPEQAQISKELLLDQGYQKDNIDNFIQNNPMVFCPNPTVTATDKKTKTSYIPCSTDYITMKGLVDKAKIQKKYFWSKVNKPKVMAIPLTQFINTLRTSEEDNIKEIRVIPTPSTIKLINQANKK
ncbi:hypothetical protein N9U98_01665 [Prochlorococcus sp. AH-736-K21]|nr:hypothetical protein [Prochlorococcus sp. AH-736-K21]MDA9707581.1 hypothetical protein [Prochlorococcus sp. AH-736-K21]